jgi:hypothetical protein
MEISQALRDYHVAGQAAKRNFAAWRTTSRPFASHI